MAPAPPLPPPQRLLVESEWGAFVDTFGRVMLEWSQRAGLTLEEAADFTGAMLELIVAEFRRVAGDPELRFRPWLKYVTHAAWCKLMEALVGDGESEPTPIVRLLVSIDAHDELLRVLDEESVFQRRRAILPRIRMATDSTEWEAFYRSVLEGLSPSDVAAMMQTSDLAVHAAIHRVGHQLEDELRRWNEQF